MPTAYRQCATWWTQPAPLKSNWSGRRRPRGLSLGAMSRKGCGPRVRPLARHPRAAVHHWRMRHPTLALALLAACGGDVATGSGATQSASTLSTSGSASSSSATSLTFSATTSRGTTSVTSTHQASTTGCAEPPAGSPCVLCGDQWYCSSQSNGLGAGVYVQCSACGPTGTPCITCDGDNNGGLSICGEPSHSALLVTCNASCAACAAMCEGDPVCVQSCERSCQAGAGSGS
jgi:hypothetical protein